MSQQTTYYVDINSQYRDLEKYQNPADFGVTFKTFTGTGNYAQGLPLNNNSYFQLSSIDPDFRDDDLALFGGIISKIHRIDSSMFYVCGTVLGASWFFYGDTPCYQSYEGAFEANWYPCNFIAKIETLRTNGFVSNYQVLWLTYFDVNPDSIVIESSSQLTQNTISFQVDPAKNIFVTLNTNYSLTDVILKSVLGTFTQQTINTNTQGYTESVNQAQVITYLSPDGQLADTNGRAWGYHTLTNRFDVSCPSDYYIKNGTNSLSQVDPSGNLIVAQDTNSMWTLFKYATLPDPGDNSQNLYNNRPMPAPYNNIVIDNIYISCGSTLDANGSIIRYNPLATGAGPAPTGTNPNPYNPTKCAFVFFGENFELKGISGVPVYDSVAFTYVEGILYPSYVLYDNAQAWSQVQFVKCNNTLYAVAGYCNVYPYVETTIGPIYATPTFFIIFQLDLTTFTSSIVGTSPAINNVVFCSSIVYGTYIYTMCRDMSDNILIYAFDVLTNNLSLINTRSVAPLPPSAQAVHFYSQTIGGNFYFFAIPSLYVNWSYDDIYQNAFLPTKETFTFTVWQYDPAINTLSEISSGTLYQNFRNASFQMIHGRTYMYCVFTVSMDITILDVTDPSNILTLPTLTCPDTYPPEVVLPFTEEYNGESHSYIIANKLCRLYNVDNPASPKHYFPFSFSAPNFNAFAYDNHQFYGPDWFNSLYLKFNSFLQGNEIVSKQVFRNTQSVLDAPINSTVFTTFKSSKGVFMCATNGVDAAVYNISQVNSASLLTTFNIALSEEVLTVNSIVTFAEEVYVFFTTAHGVFIYSCSTLGDANLWTFQGILWNDEWISVNDCAAYKLTTSDAKFYLVLGVAKKTQVDVDVISETMCEKYKCTSDGTIQFLVESPSSLLTDYGERLRTTPYAMQEAFFDNTREQIVFVFFYDYNGNGFLLPLRCTEEYQLTPVYFVENVVEAVQFWKASFAQSITKTITNYAEYPFSVRFDGFCAQPYAITQVGVQPIIIYLTPTDYYSNIAGINTLFDPYVFPTGFYATGASDFAPFRRCAITSATIQNKSMLFVGGGFNGDPDSYLQMFDQAGQKGLSQISYKDDSVKLHANVNQLGTYIWNGKITCVCLLTNGLIYLYDITDPLFANLYQEEKAIEKVYSLPPGLGSTFIHKINKDGTPDWFTYLGCDYESVPLGQFITSVGLTTDFDTNTIYSAGNWYSKVQVFEETSTGSFTIVNQLTDPTVTQNGYILSLDILNGKSRWIQPFLAANNVFPKQLVYNTFSKSLQFLIYSSANLNVYAPQFSNTFSNPTVIQKTLYTTSNSSSFLCCLEIDGKYKWNVTWKTVESVQDVQVYDVAVSKKQISVIGGTTCNLLQCYDASGNEIQKMYLMDSAGSNITSYYVYTFGLDGLYVSSQKVDFPQLSTRVSFVNIQINEDENDLTFCPNYTISNDGYLFYCNKDGSLAVEYSYGAYVGTFYLTSPVVHYKIRSAYVDSDKMEYSRVLLGNVTYPFENGLYDNYSMSLYNPYNAVVINRDYSVRTSVKTASENLYAVTNCYVVLNQVIDVKSLDRQFIKVNGIDYSEFYYSGNLSKSPLFNVCNYSIVDSTTVLVTLLHPMNAIPSGTYYFAYADIVKPILSIVPTENVNEYLMQVETMLPGDMQYVYMCSFNESLYYNLQFYPASITKPTYFKVKIESLIIPNRPLLNLRGYGGRRTVNDLPYIYVSIYNVDDEDHFDSQVVNVVYDNAPLKGKVAPLPIFKIPYANPPTNDNFIILSSPNEPIIKFTPNYYNIRIKLFDPQGNVLLFDTSASKPSDETFNGGVIPEELSNIYLRLAMTQR